MTMSEAISVTCAWCGVFLSITKIFQKIRPDHTEVLFMSNESPYRGKIKIFSDGADRSSMLEMAANPLIHGLTTNPTLMKKAGISDYRSFCRDIVKEIRNKPISFEVFADDFSEMERQALEI